jgi:Cu-Zn family superoxide dismutase
MKALPIGILVAAGMALPACVANDPSGEAMAAAAGPSTAAADIRDPSGITMARATASEIGDSIRVRVEAMGMRAGAYGAHVHTTGRCDAPDFASAGPHWNPSGQQHGKNNPRGMHKGDLPNLAVGTDGRGSFEVTIPGASLAAGPHPLLDVDGAAVVIHTSPDDYRTDPSGNSGGRIGCGVLTS